MFEGQSPDNYEQKCLCMLVLDVSGSMAGEPINQLNKGLQEFHRDILDNFVASQRLEISIVTFGSSVTCIQEPSLAQNFQMPTLTVNGTTPLVDAVHLSMDVIENRKKWYIETGQNYFRPMIVLITDGEPDKDQDLDLLSDEVKDGIVRKKFSFFSLGVKGYNHAKLLKVCSTPAPLPLEGNKFTEFFMWLSNSLDLLANSKEGQLIQLPSTSGWTQIQL